MNKAYLKLINKSVGEKKFRKLFINNVDVLENGNLSCAFFVSSILKKFNLIDLPHCTVKTTIKKMKYFGWYKVKLEKVKEGDVIVWDKKRQGKTGEHLHIGFYVGNKEAISNSWYKKIPWKHSWNYNGKRKILFVLTR